jgi:hypothetical protein
MEEKNKTFQIFGKLRKSICYNADICGYGEHCHKYLCIYHMIMQARIIRRMKNGR